MDYDVDLQPIESFGEPQSIEPHVCAPQCLKIASVTTLKIIENVFEPWEILGFLDAQATSEIIDNELVKSHKLCVNDNVAQLLEEDKYRKLYEMIFRSYLEATEYVQFVPTPLYGQNSNFTELAVLSTVVLEKKQVIPGLTGFTAYITDERLEEEEEKRSFSVLKRTEMNKKTRIMLGPASFVNHDCDPNCQLVFFYFYVDHSSSCKLLRNFFFSPTLFETKVIYSNKKA